MSTHVQTLGDISDFCLAWSGQELHLLSLMCRGRRRPCREFHSFGVTSSHCASLPLILRLVVSKQALPPRISGITWCVFSNSPYDVGPWQIDLICQLYCRATKRAWRKRNLQCKMLSRMGHSRLLQDPIPPHLLFARSSSISCPTLRSTHAYWKKSMQCTRPVLMPLTRPNTASCLT